MVTNPAARHARMLQNTSTSLAVYLSKSKNNPDNARRPRGSEKRNENGLNNAMSITSGKSRLLLLVSPSTPYPPISYQSIIIIRTPNKKSSPFPMPKSRVSKINFLINDLPPSPHARNDKTLLLSFVHSEEENEKERDPPSCVTSRMRIQIKKTNKLRFRFPEKGPFRKSNILKMCVQGESVAAGPLYKTLRLLTNGGVGAPVVVVVVAVALAVTVTV